MTINELLYESMRYDEELLAYSIYWSILNGLCNGVNDARTFDKSKVDMQQVEEMRQRNELGMKVIKLYSMPIGDNNHLLVLAENEADARGQCLKETGKLPKNIYDISGRMDKSFWFPNAQTYKTIREIKDEALVFPLTVMVFQKQ